MLISVLLNQKTHPPQPINLNYQTLEERKIEAFMSLIGHVLIKMTVVKDSRQQFHFALQLREIDTKSLNVMKKVHFSMNILLFQEDIKAQSKTEPLHCITTEPLYKDFIYLKDVCFLLFPIVFMIYFLCFSAFSNLEWDLCEVLTPAIVNRAIIQ